MGVSVGMFLLVSLKQDTELQPIFVWEFAASPSLSKGGLLNWPERKCAICKCHATVLLARSLAEQFPSVTRAPTMQEDLSLAKLAYTVINTC